MAMVGAVATEILHSEALAEAAKDLEEETEPMHNLIVAPVAVAVAVETVTVEPAAPGSL